MANVGHRKKTGFLVINFGLSTKQPRRNRVLTSPV